MPTEARKRAEQLMAEWREAYRAANGKEPTPVRYASGWFYFDDAGYLIKRRRVDVELMVKRLSAAAASLTSPLALDGDKRQ